MNYQEIESKFRTLLIRLGKKRVAIEDNEFSISVDAKVLVTYS